MKVFYKSPVDNKVYSGLYDDLKNDDNLHYFSVRFFKTYGEAKKELNKY